MSGTVFGSGEIAASETCPIGFPFSLRGETETKQTHKYTYIC